MPDFMARFDSKFYHLQKNIFLTPYQKPQCILLPRFLRCMEFVLKCFCIIFNFENGTPHTCKINITLIIKFIIITQNASSFQAYNFIDNNV